LSMGDRRSGISVRVHGPINTSLDKTNPNDLNHNDFFSSVYLSLCFFFMN
jgi:hypothetical protein